MPIRGPTKVTSSDETTQNICCLIQHRSEFNEINLVNNPWKKIVLDLSLKATDMSPSDTR